MIKNLFLFLAVLGMFAALSRAQVSSVTGQYLQDNNLLINPGFESGIGKWTNSAGTFTADYSVFVQGKASGKVVLSSQNMDFYQDSTLFASQLADGMQAILTVKIKSSVAGVRVCPRQAGVVITSLCVSVQGNNKWGLYQIPFVTGATSQGISINSNSTSITGTVYVDESYVGVSNILNSSSEAKLAGESFFPSASGCTPNRTSTTIGALGSDADCVAPTIVSQNLGAWQTTDSNGPIQIINNLPAGQYVAEFELGSYMSGAANTGFAINDGTTTCAATPGGSPTSVSPKTISCSFTYTNAGNRTFQIYVASSSGTLTITLDDITRGNARFKLYYYGSNSTYTTLNADTDWAACNFSTLAWQGLGTVTNNLECKRQGGDLLIKGRFTSGTVSGVEARMNLPTWNGVQLTSAGGQRLPVIQLAGSPLIFNASNSSFFVPLIEPSVSYITFGLQASSTNAGLTKVTGSVLTGSSIVQSINARIPIEGWQNSNIIIGQFNGLESCINSYECTDVFSAKVSAAGVVSDENINWINGNASLAGANFTITYNPSIFTVAPNCVASPANASAITSRVQFTSSTGVIVVTYLTTNGAGSADAFNITCQKQGADYIGKTAKAVASDQNVRSIGAVGVDVQSVYFAQNAACTSNPCTIASQVGGKITSVQFEATGIYRINGIDGTKYICTGSTSPVAPILNHDRGNSTSTYARILTRSTASVLANASDVSISCIGVP